MNSLSRRRTSDADRKIDLRWFTGRPRPCGSPRAGEEFRWPEDGRQTGFGLLPSLPAGPRWIMDAVALRRDGRKGTAEEHRARHRSASAVSPTCADQCRGGEWVVLLCKRSEHTLPYALEA